jgi:rod shape-determining protein MreC
MQRRSYGYRLLVLVLLSLGLMFADHRSDYLSLVRYYASYIVTPVYQLAALPRLLGDSFGTQLRSRKSLMEENMRLREQLMEQSRQLQKLEHLSAENGRLNSLLKASANVDEGVMRAQLISESPDPFAKRVLINRGARDGVFLGQPVLDAFGLMGQVVEVAPYTSWVLLVSDPLHATPVQINRNGVRAVAAGTQGALHELELRNIPNTADIRVGDLLISSGLGQRFPPGYPVGEITRVVHDPGQPFALVSAKPSAQLDISRNLLLVYSQDDGFETGADRPMDADEPHGPALYEGDAPAGTAEEH